ncbi:carbamoyltransferase HypF [Paenisporosarcina sp. TG-14]|uniref:carbamoyltransferase HypF n=1 Tax=Paenisporosarcina sp. TG-14 TaxID=1231057 RepID=UPI00030393A4|nr:carbamoyltransferase HypF [Paenisporosarcina sp. TG-14]
MRKALKIIVTGRIQGVGFRPFVYSLSIKYDLTGTVQNNIGCVIIIVEGNGKKVSDMVNELEISPPPLSKINEIRINQIPLNGYQEFSIISSEISSDAVPWMSPDAAICKHCLEELMDPHNRRFQYPFINCTQCGPRYTIIESLPYDRPNTTMKDFEMCHLCREEYENPLNRRHHAQPICCPVCGPTVTLHNQRGESIAEQQRAVNQTVDLLKQGKIIGIKGIGGYHLACDAYQERVIDQLRLSKKRPQRPLAIMAKSVDVARKFCYISSKEVEMLTSLEMPIVVLKRKRDGLLPENLSPGLSTLGIMLPYTPLHHLLFENSGLECMVMTSANSSGFPIQYKDESLPNIQEMCDYLLTHNRNIHFPIDDSVVQYNGENTLYLRRARGFVPDPLETNAKVDQLIALGGNQKNTFAVGKRNYIVMSPHIGDLENEEMIHSFEEQLHHFKEWLGVEEPYIAVDKHPFYASNSIAEKLKSKVIPIQHHHAHHVSCMEDNRLEEPCIGIILDGTGYGDDGHIWGFEFLYGNGHSFERLAHLQYTPLPGGEKAVKEPWRNAVGMLLYFWPIEGKEWSTKLFPEKSKEINIIESMINNHINTPMAGTCGRLFDAISAILGICLTSTYEGEAAIKLSDAMDEPQIESDESYSFHLETNRKNQTQLDLSPMIYQIIQDKFNKHPNTKIIQTFLRTIVSCCVQTVQRLVENRPELNRTVVLSGGSFQNIYLVREIKRRLQIEGFNVHTHKNLPCHDGGLSVGQIIIASHAVNKVPMDI